MTGSMPPIDISVEAMIAKNPVVRLMETKPDANYASLYLYSASILFEMFLYGLYVALYCICVRVLVKNGRVPQKMMLACATAMFALATADMILALAYLYWFVIPTQKIPDRNVHLKFLIYITSNVIADSLVINRCYTVWGNSKRVIIIPCIMLIFGSAAGYIYTALSSEEYRFRALLTAFQFTTVALNVYVTAFMAGRIWWISRKARAILGPGLTRKYNTAIAIIIESGAIYSVYVILDVALQQYPLDAGLTQVVGMVPTLIIVQLGLGRTTQDSDTTATAMRTEARDTTCQSEFDATATTTAPFTSEVSPIEQRQPPMLMQIPEQAAPEYRVS